MTHQDDVELIREELNHYIRLAHAQSRQLKQYAELQHRSHALINNLLQRLRSKGPDSN